MIVVWDVDGTLADNTHRRHLLPGSDLHCLAGAREDQILAFMHPDLVAADAPIDVAIRHMRELVSLLTFPFHMDLVRVVTARRESLRLTTLHWLRRYDVPLHSEQLLMRAEDDKRPSVQVKMDLAREFLPSVTAWYDDDPSMIRALHIAGVTGAKLVPKFWEEQANASR